MGGSGRVGVEWEARDNNLRALEIERYEGRSGIRERGLRRRMRGWTGERIRTETEKDRVIILLKSGGKYGRRKGEKRQYEW